MSDLNLLHETLKAMMQAIKTGEGDIAGLVGKIDQLNADIGDEAHPMLRHYLDRRSYAKAVDFLEGRDESVSTNC